MEKLGFQFPGVKALLIAAFCFAFAVGFAITLADDMVALVNGVIARKQVLEVFHYASILAISLPLMFSFGLFSLFSKPKSATDYKTKRRYNKIRATSWGDRLGIWYMLYLFGSIPLALFSPIPQFFILNHLLSERGYVFCPAPLFARNAPDRWALPGPHGPKEHCPREGAGTAS